MAAMLKVAITLFCLSVGYLAQTTDENEVFPLPLAGPCDPSACLLPDCRCSVEEIPGQVSRNETPQFVLVTFDDAITISNIEFYRDSLYDRINPNGCPISATFFMSHEWTDYELVHELHSRGFEIALHSITHLTNQPYWAQADVETLRAEISDQRKLTSYLAHIPESTVQGIRLPYLQMAGNHSFQMMAEDNFTYDLSWSTQAFMNPGIWPYTLDYASTQDCPIPPCPTAAIPGPWVIPMINWEDDVGNVCAMVDACGEVPNDADELTEFMKRQFLRHYEGNKAPFGFYAHAAWFFIHPNGFEAYKKFLDYLETLDDVYIVNAAKVIEWVKDPIPLSELKDSAWNTCPHTHARTCVGRTCQLFREGGTIERWMRSCVAECPAEYPWINNPYGLET